MNKSAINQFWTWFKENSEKIAKYDKEADIPKIIDHRVQDLGGFEWEIGPGTEKEFAFVLSPGRDFQKLTLTKLIVDLAPTLAKWEFYHARPPKRSEPVVKLPVGSRNPKVFNGMNWKYVMIEYPDRKIDLVIKLPKSDIQHPNVYEAAEVIVESVIGEEYFIKIINEIELVEEFDSQFKNHESNMIFLRDHLGSVSLL